MQNGEVQQMKNHWKLGLLFLVAVLVMGAFAGCAAKTTYENGTNIVEASEIAALVEQGNVVVVDARTAEEYAKGHLQGAIHLDPSELTISEPVKAMIAPKEQVEKVLGAKGISETDTVLIYDNKGSVYAGRVWWTMKAYGHENVKLINGGEASIVKAGLSLTAEVPSPAAKTYTAQELDKERYATKEEVEALIASEEENCIILDVRSAAEYSEGYVTSAVLYPHTKNYYADGTFKNTQAISLNYKDLGVEKDTLVVAYCKSSYRATVTAAMLEEAGFQKVKVYDGAWLEWSATGVVEKPESSAPITTQDAS
jgi:thiosulfate/3-mercaptopyruvate sulfurtransferase